MSHRSDEGWEPSAAPGSLVDAVEQADGTYLVDGGELGCARLLLLLRKVVIALPAGTVVHLQTLDPVAPIDLPAWCRMTGHRYLDRVVHDGAPRYAVQVAEDAAPTQVYSPWRLA